MQEVLVDTSVLSHAVRFRRSQEDRTVEWGGAPRTWSATVLEPKPAEPGWLEEQIDALPRIAAFAREGRLQLFTSPEIDFELWEGPPDGMRRTPLSSFKASSSIALRPRSTRPALSLPTWTGPPIPPFPAERRQDPAPAVLCDPE